ncbi:MAG: hypothetical protein WKF29_09900 [Thermoleophilaceae bacterium]
MRPGQQAKDIVRQAMADALQEAAERIHDHAAELAPKTDPEHDPDPAVTLAESGRVEMSEDGLSASVIFDAPYAAKQHEALHFKHPHGGQPKYLENALKAEIPGLAGIVAGKVRAQLKDGPKDR